MLSTGRSTCRPATSDALEAILDGRVFTPGDLPGLDPEDQLTLTRRLLREGVLVPA